jgi:hypothetical protein
MLVFIINILLSFIISNLTVDFYFTFLSYICIYPFSFVPFIFIAFFIIPWDKNFSLMGRLHVDPPTFLAHPCHISWDAMINENGMKTSLTLFYNGDYLPISS